MTVHTLSPIPCTLLNCSHTMDETLQGPLAEGVLVNVMQYLAMNQGTGSLFLRQPQGEQGQVCFEKGQVVHVSLGSQQGLGQQGLGQQGLGQQGLGQQGLGQQGVRAMALLLGWQTGNYSFRGDAPTLITMRSSIERLLLEAVMHHDVSQKKGYNPFYEDSVLTARPLHKDQVVSVSIRAVQLLPQLDGLRTLGEIAKAMNLELAEVLTAANELHRQNLTDNRAVTVAEGFTISLKSLVVNIMGPMGEIVVDDALYSLGVSPTGVSSAGISSVEVPRRVIPDLLRTLEKEIQHSRWREAFGRGAQQICQEYGIQVDVEETPS
jgi:hypothetical protein